MPSKKTKHLRRVNKARLAKNLRAMERLGLDPERDYLKSDMPSTWNIAPKQKDKRLNRYEKLEQAKASGLWRKQKRCPIARKEYLAFMEKDTRRMTKLEKYKISLKDKRFKKSLLEQSGHETLAEWYADKPKAPSRNGSIAKPKAFVKTVFDKGMRGQGTMAFNGNKITK